MVSTNGKTVRAASHRGHAHGACRQRNVMPELSPGTLSPSRHVALGTGRRRCRSHDNDDCRVGATNDVPSSVTNGLCPDIGIINGTRDDNTEEPADSRRPAVYRQTLRGRADGARLLVHILLHALSEFTDRQVHIIT